MSEGSQMISTKVLFASIRTLLFHEIHWAIHTPVHGAALSSQVALVSHLRTDPPVGPTMRHLVKRRLFVVKSETVDSLLP
eukprot:1189015-Amphidinium_carterae.2